MWHFKNLFNIVWRSNKSKFTTFFSKRSIKSEPEQIFHINVSPSIEDIAIYHARQGYKITIEMTKQ